MRNAWNVRRIAFSASAAPAAFRTIRASAWVVSIGCAFSARAILRERRLVGVLFQELRQLVFAETGQEQRRRLSASRIHAHVERPRRLVGEAARRVVELHRRDAEIGEDDVGAGEPFLRQHVRQAREVAAARREPIRAEPRRAQAGLGARQLDRIDVETDQPAARLNAFENRARVSAEAERAVDGDVAGLAGPAPAAPRRP